MKRKHSPEQIASKLRQADVALGKGQSVAQVCKDLGISEQTYYRWGQKYGGGFALHAIDEYTRHAFDLPF